MGGRDAGPSTALRSAQDDSFYTRQLLASTYKQAIERYALESMTSGLYLPRGF
jgi:hypothetical protein